MVSRLALLYALLLANTIYGSCSTVPPHPRIFVQPADVALLKEKRNVPPFNRLWQEVKQDDGALSLAVQYLLEQDEAVGRTAIDAGLALLKAGKDARSLYNPLLIGACVYDWCYPLLSQSQKQQFIKEFIRIAKLHEPGFPADITTSAVVGHNSEGWLLSGQLPAGLAIYDEEPQMFRAAETLLRQRFVPARDFHYQAHMHHQGDSYIGTRFQHDIMAAWLFRRAGLKPVFSENQQFVPYQLLYHLRPDGQQMRSGDTFDDRGRDRRKRRIALFTGSYYNDPYLLTLADMNLFFDKTIEDKIFELLLRPIDAKRKPLSDLPRAKYFPEPMGEMVVRTGWNMGIGSNDAVVHMRIGNYFFGNHQRKDFGTFQIYYKGALAVTSGVYGSKDEQSHYGKPYWMNYYHQTSSQNGLLIYNNQLKEFEAKRSSINDGGQYWPNQGQDHPNDLEMLLNPEHGYEMGQVIDYGFFPDSINPTYSYITGDITAAYLPETIEKVSRTMATITTGNRDIPLVFVVYDRVIARESAFEKKWLMHSETMPTVEGSTITIKNNKPHYQHKQRYFGKLVMQSLLPLNQKIQAAQNIQNVFASSAETRGVVVEKKRKGVESAPWTTTVSPTDEANCHEFLHVGWVTSISGEKSVEIDFTDDTKELAIQLGDSAFLLKVEQGKLNWLN
ncbi:hypothetical protein [Tunicatimonas pelagia]|uniref:hypothetical protein n=1 Tax=Tunicatimonas pelagia TaxID=931531 RepID=UPI0026666755|nr:hypothetical protein [Tunicatimonas pelagia]WKN41965.1 hypothetical protein P0M28_23265 [Tunicatimonas pelagia]